MTSRIAAALLLAGLAAPLAAQPLPGWERGARGADSREGKVEVARFRADSPAAAALGQGAVSVTGVGEADPRQRAVFEAAVIDRLAAAGYDVASADPAGGQIGELRLTRQEVTPPEARRKPVSGEMTMGVSNHGSMMGMALAVDLTKPRKALVSTRIDLRIKDRASGAVLWEGRAEIVTRDGDSRWSDQAIATRLATVLLSRFPAGT